MLRLRFHVSAALVMASIACSPASAQSTSKPSSNPSDAGSVSAAPPPLIVYFQPGSSALRQSDKATLDRASRAYNEGKPIVMILTGTSDHVGNPRMNLTLSQMRATAVLRALLNRGIPAERFQIFAKGESESTNADVKKGADAKDRHVEITWR